MNQALGTVAIADPARTAPSGSDQWDELRGIIEHAAHLLPSQGPITVFVHHNTLHALEDLPFDEAVVHGRQIFGCEPYLSEDRYREMLAKDEIRKSDLAVVLEEDLGVGADQLIGFMGTRYALRLAILEYPIRQGPSSELRWLVAETDALGKFQPETRPAIRRRMLDETRHWIMRDFRNNRQEDSERRLDQSITELLDRFGQETIENWSDATWESFTLHLLWRVCLHGVHGQPRFSKTASAFVRPRDLLLEATGLDTDRFVHELLIRFCAAYLDQGLASWALRRGDERFFESFLAMYAGRFRWTEGWLSGLSSEIERIEREHISPLESIDESLRLLGVSPHERQHFVEGSFLALRGWAGMIRQMEVRADRVAKPVPPGTLVEFLAVRLLLDRLAVRNVAHRSLKFDGNLADLPKVIHPRLPEHHQPNVEQRAFQVFQLAQALGWNPRDLYRLTRREWVLLLEELESFSGIERRRIYQLGFERRYRVQTLDAIATHAAAPLKGEPDFRARSGGVRPRFQLVTCIDDREESLRRHLEEVEPAVETFGTPGFYAVPMYYRGAADAHYVPLCPIVVKPKHWVKEHVALAFEDQHRRSTQTRKMLGSATHRVHLGSRTFFGGLLVALAGPVATVPLVARVLFPRLTARILRNFGRLVQPPPVTRLDLERSQEEPGAEEGHRGFSIDERAASVERLLRDMGLTSNFARLVVILGHGSSSLNNPHESAYNCGACGGSRGGPNARAIATMANDPRIRAILSARGLTLPDDTLFIGGFHNTCDESITYFDLHDVPPTHHADFEEARRLLNQTRERNAQERCRRFASAELSLTPEAALRHVEARAEDLSQTRPEYNHATNAVCFVGRRQRTRGLFLDRRCFLNSYDPTADDPEHSTLVRILQAAVPVCGGINLEYYFSTVDPVGFGCGTKLPHNITSLLGVMDGAASDLRTGLSSQMTEIHDPIRLLFVIETSPEALTRIMDRDAAIGRLCRNEWVQVAALDPDSSRIHVLDQGSFRLYRPENSRLPEVARSADWFRGWRENLGYARIVAKGKG